jgi:hypothetical protein
MPYYRGPAEIPELPLPSNLCRRSFDSYRRLISTRCNSPALPVRHGRRSQPVTSATNGKSCAVAVITCSTPSPPVTCTASSWNQQNFTNFSQLKNAVQDQGSEVQILSPRPIFSNRYTPCFARRKTPVDSAYELILGSSADPQFGPVLLVGQGGQNT